VGNTERRITSIETRVNTIETALLKKKVLSARDISREITSGNRPEEHLGKYSIQAATQLVKSIENSISRDTINTFSNKDKVEQIESLEARIIKIKNDLPQATALIARLQIIIGKLK